MSEAAFPLPDDDSYVDDRDVIEVAYLHGLHIREFLGKTILNLGSGSGNLQADLDGHGVRANVISVDFSAAALQEAALRRSANRFIAADVSALPLPDESVDLAIATYSLPLWARTPAEMASFFSECRRVVKVGGMLAIFPLFVNAEQDYSHPDSSENWHALDFSMRVEIDELSRSRDWQNLRRSKQALLYARTANTHRTPHPEI